MVKSTRHLGTDEQLDDVRVAVKSSDMLRSVAYEKNTHTNRLQKSYLQQPSNITL
ncbi:UNVERIFIED_CONTAM: hypothetical protein FKN15_027250 [Acipenser sinensis]